MDHERLEVSAVLGIRNQVPGMEGRKGRRRRERHPAWNFLHGSSENLTFPWGWILHLPARPLDLKRKNIPFF
ncbi:unnamed protein product, partial [Mycena citricolor]